MEQLMEPQRQGLLDPRDKAQRTAQLQRALELVTSDYITAIGDCKVAPQPNLRASRVPPAQTMRLYRLNKAVYAPKEDFLQKISTVLYTAYAQNTPVVVIIRADGNHTEYYLGVQLTTSNDTSQGTAFQEAFCGNFVGSDLIRCTNDRVQEFSEVFAGAENVTAVSGLPSLRGEDKFSIAGFVQGIENMVDSLHGCSYTMLIKADPVQGNDLLQIKQSYENIYSQLSGFAKTTFSFNENDTASFANARGVTNTHTEGSSASMAIGDTHTVNESSTHTVNHDERGQAGSLIKGGLAAAGAAIGGLGMGPVGALLGGAVGGVLGGVVGGLVTPFVDTTSDATTHGTSNAHSVTNTTGTNRSDAHALSQTQTTTESTTNGRTIQFTYEDKRISDTLRSIEENIKRLDQCAGLGAFASAAYVVSNNRAVCTRVASVYNALMRGDRSALQATQLNSWQGSQAQQVGEYLQRFLHPQFEYPVGKVLTSVTPAVLVSGKELALQIGLPKRSFPGVTVMQHAPFDCNPPQNGDLKLGQLYRQGVSDSEREVKLSVASLAMHTFITGSTGAGKSNTIYHILNDLVGSGLHFLVVEPAKGEYKAAFGGHPDVAVYGTNPQLAPLLRIDPFSFPVGKIHVLEHLDRLVEIFNVCWPMYAAMPAILKDACERAYRAVGWDLDASTNMYDDARFPTFADVLEQIERVVDESAYSADTSGDYKGALLTRVRWLTTGINRHIFAQDALQDSDLFDQNVIVDLSRVGSTETKALLMGLLVMKLQEYRMAMQEGTDSELRHVTVLEEAHNLLKRTSTEQSSESANLLGKSVEMLGNAIAEMRTYGEGFIIADQAPGLLDMAVIRNTNTKIILRLPDQSDRELVGKAAGLQEEQIAELAKLPLGVAAVYQNEWLAPVLCKMERFTRKRGLRYVPPSVDQAAFRRDVLNIIAFDTPPEDVEAFCRQVKQMAMADSLKQALLAYFAAPVDSRRPLRATIAAAFFDADSVLRKHAKAPQPDALEQDLRWRLQHTLPQLTEREAQCTMTLIIEGALAHNTTYEPVADAWQERLHRKGLIP